MAKGTTSTLAERKSPFDMAPDWVEQSYGQRLFSALTALRLFGFLTEDEVLMVSDRIDEWINKNLKRNTRKDIRTVAGAWKGHEELRKELEEDRR